MMKFILGLSLIAISLSLNASEKSICGPSDNRISVQDNPRVLRVSKKGDNSGCTATMISERCAISAGHCKITLYKGEVNPPKSRGRRGRAMPTTKENTYFVDQDSIEYEYDGWSDKLGKDWSVFQFKKNEHTGKYPGEKGNYYQVDLIDPIQNGDGIEILGFGIDEDNPELNATLQSHSGKIIDQDTNDQGELAILGHDIDTTGGNSGSSILRVSQLPPFEKKIIGIHTNGGCHASGGKNKGTIILNKPNLVAAIKRCLDKEKRLK